MRGVPWWPQGLVKDQALSPLWLSFDPWTGNFCILQVWTKKKQITKLFVQFFVQAYIQRSTDTGINMPGHQCLVSWSEDVVILFYFSFFFCFFFGLFRASPAACGGFQARGQIRGVAVGLHHSHSNTRSETCLPPTPQLTATPFNLSEHIFLPAR